MLDADSRLLDDITLRPTRIRYLVLTVLCVAAALAYIHRSCISVPAASMQADLGLSDPQMGWIMSAFFLGYTLFQVPGGWLGDHFGTRAALTLFTLVWSLATGMMGLTRRFELLYALWFLNGVAQAGIFPCSINSFTRWFPEAERALPSGLLGAFMSVGAATASLVAAALLQFVDWPECFLILAAPGILFAAGFYLWFRDSPRQHAWVNSSEIGYIESGNAARPRGNGGESFWRELLARPSIYLICGQQFFRAASYIFYVTWFPSYLQGERGVSVVGSGLLASLPLVGVVAGSTCGGVLIDRIWRRTGSRRLSRRGVGLAAVLAAGGFLLLAQTMSDLEPAVACIVASGFFAGMSGPAGYTTTIDLAGNRVATVFSIMNLCGNAGAFLLPLVVAKLRWDVVLVFLAGLYGCAAILWGLLFIEREPLAARMPVRETASG